MERLRKGRSLSQGQGLDSKDGRYRLTVQADGDLVLRRAEGTVWSSETRGNPEASLTMQADGDLVLHSPAGVALWATDTSGHPGAWLKLQTDGDLVVYAKGGRTPLWASNPALKSRRVDGFLPSKSGLPFRNDYPAGTRWPVVDLPLVGKLLTGDAGNGLCGGFGFTVATCSGPGPGSSRRQTLSARPSIARASSTSITGSWTPSTARSRSARSSRSSTGSRSRITTPSCATGSVT